MIAEPAAHNSGTGGSEGREVITVKLIANSLGETSDAKLAALIATGATTAEFEEALAWANGESDAMGEMEKRLAGAAAQVYEILTAEERYPEEER